MACELVNAVFAATNDWRERFTMLMGVALETATICGPWPDNPSSGAMGPFQVLPSAHPNITRAQASDPWFIVPYALNRGFTAKNYRTAVQAVPAGLWLTNPARAAALATCLAEAPEGWNPEATRCTAYEANPAQIPTALRLTTAAVPEILGLLGANTDNTAPSPTTPDPAGENTATPLGLPNPLGKLGDWFGTAVGQRLVDGISALFTSDIWLYRVVPFLIGVPLVIMGAYLLVPESTKQELAGTAIKAAAVA